VSQALWAGRGFDQAVRRGYHGGQGGTRAGARAPSRFDTNPEASTSIRHAGRAARAAALLAPVLAAATLALPSPAGAPGHRAPSAAVVTDPSDLLVGPAAEGRTGDLRIANDDVAFIVSAVDHLQGNSVTGGHVLDAASAPAWSDELGNCITLLEAWPRQAAYDTVRVASDGSGGEAVVLAVGHDSANAAVSVTTRYSLRAGERFLTVETEVVNGGLPLAAYSAGDALSWGNTLHFLPGYGFDVGWTESITEWLGGKGTQTCYGYAVAAGLFPATHGSTWSDPLPLETDVPTGGVVAFTRFLVAASPDLAAVSDVVHVVRGTSTGTLVGTVSDEATGEGIAGATVTIGVTASAPYTQALTAADGGYVASLPPASFLVTASADGYLEDETRVTVSAGLTAQADVLLRSSAWTPSYADTLTVIARPIMSVPVIRTPGSSFTIEALAPPDATGWQAALTGHGAEHALALSGAVYRADLERWTMTAAVPVGTPAELYDLRLRAAGGIDDTARHAVAVRDEIDGDFYVVQITDTHTPTHRFWYQSGADTDTTELDDLRAMIDDINVMNPDFVIHTGDLVNEGELEDFMSRHYFTRAQRVLGELRVPLYMVPGNHDIGGWDETPPPDGNSRRAWWRFFGWRQLGDPPPGDPSRTQDYSFDHGGVHFTGLEAYDNYDEWRYAVYGATSFTSGQMAWLASDVGALDPVVPKVLFYHYDFAGQLNLQALGVTCALWGHIHRTSGSLAAPPYNLSLDCGCDGHRGMRVVRFHDGAVLPQPPITPGASGQRLRVSYDAPNDGTAHRLTATIVNENNLPFEDGLVRFVVPADSVPYEAVGGALAQTLVDGETATCCVSVPIAASAVTTVAVRPGPRPEPPVTRLALGPCTPNPSTVVTAVRYGLPEDCAVLLEVFDLAGRKVATLADGPAEAGWNEASWDLSGPGGERVASGVYFVRLEAGGESAVSKVVVVK